MMAYGGLETLIHSFLNFALDGDEWAVLHPGRFTLWKGFPMPLAMRLSGPQRRSGRFGGKKNLLPLPGIEVYISLYKNYDIICSVIRNTVTDMSSSN
jgi:hypothetical protein